MSSAAHASSDTVAPPRRVLITGAADRLGAHLASALASAGHHVAVHYRRSREKAEALAQSIRQTGGVACTVQADLVDSSQAAAAVKSAAAQLGTLDTVINNVGTFVPKKFYDLTDDDWQEGWNTTATAARNTICPAIELLRASGRGRILNIGDILADTNGFKEPAFSYYAGKCALWMMTQTLAVLEAPHRVTVNMISPGMIEDSVGLKPLQQMPAGRYTSYDDVVHATQFLLSPHSDMITGTNLRLSGGWCLAPLFASVLEQNHLRLEGYV